jgi:hypothetical protein
MTLVTDHEITNIPVTPIKFYKSIAVSVLVYGIENLVLNRCERRKIETTEISFLRRVSGHTDNMIIRNALQIYD